MLFKWIHESSNTKVVSLTRIKLSMTIKMLDSLHLECLVSHGKQLTAQLLPDHHAVNTEHTPAPVQEEHTYCMVESVELCCGGV